MRILQINTIAGTTATGTLVDSIARGIIAAGDEAMIAHAYGSSRVSGAETYKIGSTADRYYHAMMTRLTDANAFFSTRATMRLIDNIADQFPQIVHLHNLHGYYLNIRLLIDFLKTTNIPVVLTMHDCWALTGHCSFPIFAQCNLYRDASCHHCPQSHSYPRAYFDNSSQNIKHKMSLFSSLENFHIVCVSDWLSAVVKDSWLGNKPITTITNGVNLNLFNIRSQEVRERGVLGVANVWTVDKGLQDFIELRKLLPSDINITMVGLSPSQIKKIPAGITAFGHVSQEELVSLYNRVSATVNMSHGETFGMVTAESLACGTPVFAFDNTANSELVTPETGIIVDDGNIAAMAHAVVGNLFHFSCLQCREAAVARFDSNRMAVEYIKLYRSILAQG